MNGKTFGLVGVFSVFACFRRRFPVILAHASNPKFVRSWSDMNPYRQPVTLGDTAVATASNKLIRNTYTLLAMTLLISAATAGISIALNLPHSGLLITLVGYFGLLIVTYKLRDSAWGLLSVFGLTGFMGLTLGPIVNHYHRQPNGGEIVMKTKSSTDTNKHDHTAKALTTRKDFSFMGGFLMVGI